MGLRHLGVCYGTLDAFFGCNFDNDEDTLTFGALTNLHLPQPSPNLVT